MADCVFKYTWNTYSIDGLYEVMKNQNIGDPGPLAALMADPNYQTDCKAIRNLRNKLVGHMDKTETFTNLQNTLAALPLQQIYRFVKDINRAVWNAARSDIAIRSRYQLENQPIPDTLSVRSLGTVRYF